MPHPIEFDLHYRPPFRRSSGEPIPLAIIRLGDMVRRHMGGPFLWVIAVDGEDIYCEGFVDPFKASSLEVVN